MSSEKIPGEKKPSPRPASDSRRPTLQSHRDGSDDSDGSSDTAASSVRSQDVSRGSETRLEQFEDV